MSTYTERVDMYLSELEGVSPGITTECPECLYSFGVDPADTATVQEIMDYLESVGDEGHFSHYPCEICASPLGGQRYTWHAWGTDKSVDPDGELVHGDCCTDCLMYLANGEEPEAHYLLAEDEEAPDF